MDSNEFSSNDKRWDGYQSRYMHGEYRAHIFRDMILAELKRLSSVSGEPLTIVDIGCGGGFDGDARIQQEIAKYAGSYIGIEPDKEVNLLPIFSRTFQSTLEDAAIEPDSVDVAFAVMVLEHIENPSLFWNQIRNMLKHGGIFIGFTVDARHWFVDASVAFDKLRIKDIYLNALHGKRGEQRYENYGVYYRINDPDSIRMQTIEFARSETIAFQKIGQLDYYFPNGIKWVARTVDRIDRWRGKAGNVIAIRIER